MDLVAEIVKQAAAKPPPAPAAMLAGSKRPKGDCGDDAKDDWEALRKARRASSHGANGTENGADGTESGGDGVELPAAALASKFGRMLATYLGDEGHVYMQEATHLGTPGLEYRAYADAGGLRHSDFLDKHGRPYCQGSDASTLDCLVREAAPSKGSEACPLFAIQFVDPGKRPLEKALDEALVHHANLAFREVARRLVALERDGEQANGETLALPWLLVAQADNRLRLDLLFVGNFLRCRKTFVCPSGPRRWRRAAATARGLRSARRR